MISRLRRLRQIKTAAALRKRRLKSQKRSATLNRVPLQIELAVFAIKARDFACRFAINGALLQIGPFITRYFALPHTQLSF